MMIIGNRKSGWLFDPEDDEQPQGFTEANPPLDVLRKLVSSKPIHRLVPLKPVEPTPPDAPKPDGAHGDEAPNQP